MDSTLLKNIMIEKNISIHQLAKIMGISNKQLKNKLFGRSQFTIEETLIIELILDLDNPREIFLHRTSHKCNEK